MKKFFNKLGFHKMDEMEQHIAFKAQRNAFLFLEIALLCWTFYESYKVYAYHTHLNPLPCLLLSASLIIQSVSQIIMTHHAVKGDEEGINASPLLKTILLWCVITAIIVTVGVFIVFSVTKV